MRVLLAICAVVFVTTSCGGSDEADPSTFPKCEEVFSRQGVSDRIPYGFKGCAFVLDGKREIDDGIFCRNTDDRFWSFHASQKTDSGYFFGETGGLIHFGTEGEKQTAFLDCTLG